MQKAASHKGSASYLDFEKVKMRAQKTHEMIIPKVRQIDPKVAQDMETCGDFVYVCQCSACTAKHFAGLNRCRRRLCLECAHHRSMSYVAKMMERIVPYLEQGYTLNMLTMTIRDQDDLADQVSRLKRAWRIVQHDDKGYREKFRRRFVGGFRTFEIKKGKQSGKWHAHMHALVLTPPSFEKDYEWFQPAWKNATGGDGSIEIHKIKKRKNQHLGVLKAVIETVKYVVSPDKETIDLENFDDFKEMYLFLKGFRAVNSWGLLRGLIQDAEAEANKPFDEKKLADFICRLCGSKDAEFKVLWGQALRNSYLLDM